MHFRSFGSKLFIIEAGDLISSGSKPFLVEAGELIRHNLGRSHDTFTDVTKLVESFGLFDSVL